MQLLQAIRKNMMVIFLVLLYLAINLVLTYKEIYFLNLIPLVLLVIYLAISRIDIAYFIIVACTPVSIQLLEFVPSLPIDFAIPTEPLLFGIMLLLIYRAVQLGIFNRRIFNHKVSYAILFSLFWIFLTSVTSSMPLVSFKFLLARIWFLSVYFFLAIIIFREHKNIRIFILCYTLPMLIVIFYSISRHLSYGLFDKEAAHKVMNPFFRDHTSYGAILAMLFFSVGGLVLNKKRNLLMQAVVWGSWALVTIALILSYTRAAWISVIISLGVLLLVFFRIRLKYVFLIAFAILIYLTGQRIAIIQKMEKNRQTSSATLSEHVKSISNITTDESNLERLNRWNAAFRMFRERPVFGWGPGTYMFKYAPFQRSSDKTSISTDFGDMGNAHSEYIGPLVESGIPGTLSFLLICILTLITGFNVYYKISDRRMKQLVLSLLLGYITYLIHGTLNNFLDTDKASALFWGFTAVFVSLDISLKKLNPKD
ncbi:MAG TPA: O-antigen ligase family protein [Bacteroidales bacterium]|jgi:O-antigen ligase|nr:O-antigen ligase family protein [Bacteroidales bacterium]